MVTIHFSIMYQQLQYFKDYYQYRNYRSVSTFKIDISYILSTEVQITNKKEEKRTIYYIQRS